jgi:HPt (histidine-containing phosphotransfer) domain-containing protein
MMPQMDGVNTTLTIRALGINVPIIALTANVVAGAREEILTAGMDDYLTKPINKTLLFKMLEEWIPAGKIKKAPVETAVAGEAGVEAQGEFWSEIEQIEGLSVRTGLERVFGQRDVYEKSLKLTIKEIEKCDKNLSNFLATGDLRTFSIEVHSMKGSLANIGAMELSVKAQELETAADHADAGLCAAKLPLFLKALRRLNSSLAKAFSKENQSHGPIKIPPELPSIFEKLTVAFAETDFPAIDRGIESLNALNTDGMLKEEIEHIKDAVLMMDYDGAMGVMRKLL